MTAHTITVFEDREGAAFAACPCGWVSEGYPDREVIDEEEPPFALSMAHDAGYGHLWRTRQGFSQ